MEKSVESVGSARIGSDIREALAKRGTIVTEDQAEHLARALIDLLRLDLLEPAKETDDQGRP
jgi:hypothetical protein